MINKILVTGAGGLIGSEVSRFFLDKGYFVQGLDNNMREEYFGPKGNTRGNVEALKTNERFSNFNLDIRRRQDILEFMAVNGPYDLVVHTAAQPSHDWAKKEPFTDFDVNAAGTLNMLEGFRQHSHEGVFIFTSTNKVYGDNPNKVKLVEADARYDYDVSQTLSGVSQDGISESMSLDHCTHSIFGVNKVAADLMAQEYGRNSGLKVGVFRGGCLTGPQHSAVELHGFLSYIVDCAVNHQPYTIFGYKGKQVRDQIHSFDVANAFYHFMQNPTLGEAYNLGGTKENAASVLEVIDLLRRDHNLDLEYKYSNQNRVGDHICYYSDMSKFKTQFPEWKLTRSLPMIIDEIVQAKKK